jgi:dTDP-4-dehydrorhamnose 3,5-epimerase
LSGRVFDVIVDLRLASETQGKWACVELSREEPMCLFLPPKIAHGYQTLEANSSLLYLLSEIYSPDHAYTLHVSDQDLQIAWPLPIFNLSEKDLQGSTLLESSKLV